MLRILVNNVDFNRANLVDGISLPGRTIVIAPYEY